MRSILVSLALVTATWAQTELAAPPAFPAAPPAVPAAPPAVPAAPPAVPAAPPAIPAASPAIPAAPVAGASKGCSRESLIAARDSIAARRFDVISPRAIIAANNAKVASIDATPLKAPGQWTPLSVQAVDTETCQIATFRVSDSQLLSWRLKLDGGKVTEVDTLQAVKGDQFFRPSGFPKSTPALYTSDQRPGAPPRIPEGFNPAGVPSVPASSVQKGSCKAGGGASRPLNRKELIYVASTYCDGLKGAPWDSCVVGGSSCPRNENGVTTTQNCAKGTGVFGFTTRGRRWVADTKTGVVLGIFYFDYGNGKNLYLHEYFKIDRGVLNYILAPMKNIPHAQASAKTFTGPDGPEPAGVVGGGKKGKGLPGKGPARRRSVTSEEP